MMTTLCFLASLQKASVLGPGIFSASLKFAWSSLWQKYCERKSSCVQMIFAPDFAARPTSARVFLRFTSGRAEAEVWISPSLTMDEAARFMRSSGWFVQPYGFIEHDGLDLRFRRRSRGRFLAKKFADKFAERLVGRAVTRAVDVKFEVIHQLVGGRVAAVRIMREAVMENVVQLVVNP